MRQLWDPRLDPPRTLGVLVDSVAVGIMRALEIPRFFELIPMLIEKGLVTADLKIVVRGHQKQGRGIGRSKWIRQAFPIHQVSGLRPFVNDLSFRTLPVHQELKLIARQLKVAVRVHGVEGPKRISSKEPAKARPRGFS